MGIIQNFEKFLSRHSTMSKLARIPTQDFDRDVTAVAMDDRFILVGQVDGKLSAVYHKNGVAVFSAKISDSEITAVCCEEQDETDNPIFYAGDIEGNLYTVNKKGKVLKTAELQARKGKIHTIVNRNKYSIYAHTSSGSTSFSHATCAIEFGNKVKNFEQVFAYAVIDDAYENMIEEGTAENQNSRVQVTCETSHVLPPPRGRGRG